MVVLAVRRCSFLLVSGVESSNAKFDLTLVPAGGGLEGTTLTESPVRVKTQTHKGVHVVLNAAGVCDCLFSCYNMFHMVHYCLLDLDLLSF